MIEKTTPRAPMARVAYALLYPFRRWRITAPLVVALAVAAAVLLGHEARA